jgi:hypothetical protein
VTLTPHPLLVPRYKKQTRAIPLLSLGAFVAYEKGETRNSKPEVHIHNTSQKTSQFSITNKILLIRCSIFVARVIENTQTHKHTST